MPTLSLTRKPKIDPPAADQVYVAIESFASLETWESVRKGARLRGDNPLLKLGWPKYFVLDGATDEEIGRARQALYAVTWDTVPAPDPTAVALPEPIPAEFLVRANRFVVHNGYQMAQPGQAFDSRSPIAMAITKQYPDALEAAPEAA